MSIVRTTFVIMRCEPVVVSACIVNNDAAPLNTSTD